MYNCIFSGHCTQPLCDKSCPTLAETTYLLERNGLTMSSDVFKAEPSTIDLFSQLLVSAEGDTKAIFTKKSNRIANLLVYCSICQKWRGSRLHCTVYNLKFSQYLEEIKKSWSTKFESDQLEYMRIWSSKAKVLIISNIDYVNFKDFECQTLLTLLQSRDSSEFTTIVVSPITSSLVGSGSFFVSLISLLKSSAMMGGKEVNDGI